ncbi:MAG: CvpA family protein [Flavobacteriia bacterium]|nr:CvpA family protein [Flavobacteriia bacterium]
MISPIDIALLILAAFGFYKGFKNGVLIEIATLIALFLGFYGAQHLSSFTARLLSEHLDWNPEKLYLMSLISSFVLIVISVYLLGKALTKVASMILLGGINKILGGLFGLIKIGVILSVLCSYGHEYFNLIALLPQESVATSLAIEPLMYTGDLLRQEVFISENLARIKTLFN